jgi:hypothetical protein
MITTLLAPKPTWVILLLANIALSISVLGGILAGLDFWGLMSLMVQLFLGLIVFTLAVALTWQHRAPAKSGLGVVIGVLVCVHALALVLGSAKGI